MSQVEVDKKIDVELQRNGKPLTVTAQIKEQPAKYPLARVVPPPGQPGQQTPGEDNEDQSSAPAGGALAAIEVRELTPQLAQSLGVPSSVRGVVVTRVGAENGAGGLRPGDVIEAVNQEPVASLRDYQQVVQSLDPNQAQVLSVCRQRSRSFVVVKPG